MGSRHSKTETKTERPYPVRRCYFDVEEYRRYQSRELAAASTALQQRADSLFYGRQQPSVIDLWREHEKQLKRRRWQQLPRYRRAVVVILRRLRKRAAAESDSRAEANSTAGVAGPSSREEYVRLHTTSSTSKVEIQAAGTGDVKLQEASTSDVEVQAANTSEVELQAASTSKVELQAAGASEAEVQAASTSKVELQAAKTTENWNQRRNALQMPQTY